MKRNRLIFFAAWILSVVGISFRGGVVSYGVFWTLTLIPVLMVIYLTFVLLCFKIYQQVNSKAVTSRSPVSYYFTLQNESLFAFSRIRVSFFEFGVDYADLDRNKEYELMPHSGYKTTTSIICQYRGEYYIGIEKIIITDFLNLFRLTYKNPEPFKVNVLPAIEYPADSPIELSSLYLNNVSHFDQTIRDLLVRPYNERDSFRSINWKATAKNQKLMVCNMISEEQNSVRIVLDTKRNSDDYKEYLPAEDRLLSKLISIVLYFTNRHINVEVIYYSGKEQHIALNDMNRFDDFYSKISGVIFAPDNEIPFIMQESDNVIILRNDSEKSEGAND